MSLVLLVQLQWRCLMLFTHEKKINFIGVRDERTGTHMADGYARASNKPGVIIAGQNGPGATNLVTGVAQAKAAFSPVVAIAGSYSTKDKMEDAFQGLDQQSLFAPCHDWREGIFFTSSRGTDPCTLEKQQRGKNLNKMTN